MSSITKETSSPTTLYLIEPSSTTNGGSENRFAISLPRLLDDQAFFEFCQRNPTMNIERTRDGEVVIMPPAGFESSYRNNQITTELEIWNRQNGDCGYVSESSGGYRLPNRATRAPDAAWTRRDRIDALTREQREVFVPVCPDFVVDLMSPSDSLEETQAKMEEYIANGSLLGWLIDRKNRRVYIYRPGQPLQQLDDPTEITGDPELPGFILPMRRIF